MVILGVLAIQGAFTEHIKHFEEIIKRENISNLEVIKVSSKELLDKCDGLVIPGEFSKINYSTIHILTTKEGGESSAISITAEKIGMLELLVQFLQDDTKPIWGTCAGLIMLSSKIINALPLQKALGGIDIEVKRNAFGRQLDSFIQQMDFSSFIKGCDDFPTVFIRAPVVSDINITTQSPRTDELGTVYANGFTNLNFKEPVQILSTLDEDHHNLVVAVRQGNRLGTSFHPELTGDHRFHEWFLHEFLMNQTDI